MRNEMNILNLEHISKIYGDKVIFDDISYGVQEGEKIGIIGINGTGKTTLLRIIAGLEEPDEGQVITQNGLRITYLSQHPQFPDKATILSYVTNGIQSESWNPETEARTVLNRLGIENHEEETFRCARASRCRNKRACRVCEKYQRHYFKPVQIVSAARHNYKVCD